MPLVLQKEAKEGLTYTKYNDGLCWQDAMTALLLVEVMRQEKE